MVKVEIWKGLMKLRMAHEEYKEWVAVVDGVELLNDKADCSL